MMEKTRFYRPQEKDKGKGKRQPVTTSKRSEAGGVIASFFGGKKGCSWGPTVGGTSEKTRGGRAMGVGQNGKDVCSAP